MKKERLDVLLVNRGLYESRAKAQAAVMSGQILVNDKKIDKPGTPTAQDASIRVLGLKLPYVSRGGLKLEKALHVFSIRLEGKVVADIGASTGGFTDCALQNGAAMVYAVDVGYGQLAWKLRNDPRVVNLERTNARYLTEDSMPKKADVVTIDVAFISLEKILPAVRRILTPDGIVIALIKPQFEAGKVNIGKKGVVRSAAVHEEVVQRVIDFAGAIGFGSLGLDFSPVRGPEGNIEYLLYLTAASTDTIASDQIKQVVSASHKILDKYDVNKDRDCDAN